MENREEKIPIGSLEVGQEFIFGVTVLSEKEIIDFAQRFDPLPFHTDPQVAAQSRFKGLVASGPHLFMKIYKEHWVPCFGHSVAAGLEINHWKFIRPVFAGQQNHAKVVVKHLQANPEKQQVVVTWHFAYADEAGNPIQTAEMTVLHRTDDF